MTVGVREIVIGLASLLGFCVFFTLFWLFVTGMLTLVSGWRGVAARFPAGDIPPAGESWSNQISGFGLVHENRVTRVIVSPAGLHLSAILPFRFARPPILVPWDQVKWKSRRRFLWVHDHRLDLGGRATLTIKDRGYRAAAAYMTGPSPSV
jgi:hypothetical protein